MRRLPLLCLLLLLVLPAAPARAAEVRSGPLTVQLQEDPWQLTFVTEGGPTLREAAGSGPSGPIGFRTAGGWVHATRALSVAADGDALVAEAETDDPLGRRLSVRLAPGPDGVVAVTVRVLGDTAGVEALGMGFDARDGERFLGFGERATPVDHRGLAVESYVSDGPYQREERPFIAGFVPAWGLRFRDDATYYPVPWLLSTRGYGVLADTSATVYHRLGSDRPDAWSVEATSAPEGLGAPAAPAELTLRVFAGPRPADALRRFTELTGRQPSAGADWVFGPWFQPGGSTERQVEQIEGLREAGAPLSVAQTYLHYLPCGDHVDRRDAERARVQALKRLRVAVTTYINPMLCSNYEPAFSEARDAGALTRNAAGEPYLYRYSTGTQFLVGQYDFLRPAGREHFGRRLNEAIADGHDGWMEDFGEYTPLDSRSGDEDRLGTDVHNRYPVDYHCAAYEHVQGAPRPIVRFQRSGWTGAARCAPVVWGGDPTTDWGFDGLQGALRGGLSMGLSGVSTWGSDIGGFFALGTRRLSAELLRRWVQLGFVSGVMRMQRNGIAVPDKERPQVEEAGQLSNWRRYAALRTQLLPYLQAADAEYRRSGLPIMRHLALTHPRDREAVAREDQFLFGPDILAAPVLEAGVTERTVRPPRGRWIDFWRSVEWDDAAATVRLKRARTLRGRREATVPAPAEEIPLLVRRGTLLPLLPPDVDSLAPSAPEGELRLLAWPHKRSAAAIGEDGEAQSRLRRRAWKLRLVLRLRSRVSVEAALPWRACRVVVGGRRVRFEQDRSSGVVRFTRVMRRATVRVKRCRR